MTTKLTLAQQACETVLTAFGQVDAQDYHNEQGLKTARTKRHDACIGVTNALKVRGVTAELLANTVKARRAELKILQEKGHNVNVNFAPDLAYESDTGIGWIGAIGTMVQMDGVYPEDITIANLTQDISAATKGFFDSILRRRGMTQDVAYALLHEEAERIREAKRAKKAEPTVAARIKALMNALDKALAMDLDADAISLLNVVTGNIDAAIKDTYTKALAKADAEAQALLERELELETAAALTASLEKALVDAA